MGDQGALGKNRGVLLDSVHIFNGLRFLILHFWRRSGDLALTGNSAKGALHGGFRAGSGVGGPPIRGTGHGEFVCYPARKGAWQQSDAFFICLLSPSGFSLRF